MEDNSVTSAFQILSYLKKLCLHPQLLLTNSVEKKHAIGLLSPEEEAVRQAAIDFEVQNTPSLIMRTRRRNKETNKAQIEQCKELEKADKLTPDDDMDVGSHDSGYDSSEKPKKRGKKHSEQPAEEIKAQE